MIQRLWHSGGISRDKGEILVMHFAMEDEWGPTELDSSRHSAPRTSRACRSWRTFDRLIAELVTANRGRHNLLCMSSAGGIKLGSKAVKLQNRRCTSALHSAIHLEEGICESMFFYTI
jgi:hypothetical protein